MPRAEQAGFGSQLRRLRKARDLTQEMLAQQVGCVVDTIKKIEAGRRRPSRELAVLLASALDLPEAEHSAFLHAARSALQPDLAPLDPAVFTPPASADPALLDRSEPPHEAESRTIGLPIPPTALLGRAWELANLHVLLHQDEARLITLLGPGGVGKTRLALQVAHASVAHSTLGVVFVGLAAFADPQHIAPAIAQALGLREMRGVALITQLQEYLAPRRTLLVLDNFEHLLEATPIITALLTGAPRLSILVTSRATLRLASEHIFPVLPLAVPAYAQLPPLERLDQYAAIQFFVARVQALRPNFTLTAENAPLVVAICRQLDGLPLAIELAVARMKLFALADLLDRLQNPLALLTGGPRDAPARHQALAATIDWSYLLLTRAEQRCLACLAVFADGCTVDLAEYVCAEPTHGMLARSVHEHADLAPGQPQRSALDILTALVDQSLLQSVEHTSGVMRLVMLETIRSYALEQLQASGAEAAVRERHAQACLKLAEEALPQLYGPEQISWLHRLEAERSNLLGALTWWRTHDPARGLQLAATLWPFWDLRGHFSEGREWLESLLPLATHAADPIRAYALHGAGHFAAFQHDHDQAQAYLGASMMLYATLAQPAQAAHVCRTLGLVAWFRGDHDQAEASLVASVAQARASGSVWHTADALHFLGHIVFDSGDSARAQAIFSESLELFRRTGDQRNIALPLKDLGLIASQRGDYAAALPLYNESLAYSRPVEDTWHIADTLLRLGDLARLRGDLAEARAIYLEALDGWQRTGAKGGVAETLNLLGHVALEQGDPALARHFYTQALNFQRVVGSPRVIAGLVHSLGQVAWHEQDLRRAEEYFHESLDLNVHDGYWPGIGDCLMGCAAIAAAEGNPARAARLLGAAEMPREQLRGFMPLAEQSSSTRIVATIGALLTPLQLAAYRAEGRALTLEAAVAYARERATDHKGLPQSATSPIIRTSALHQAGLTVRELEVLQLVAQGFTDQRVADELVISIRTVQSHLRSIYDKLGCTTRTAAAHIARTAEAR